MQSDQLNELASALAKAQAAMENAKKDSANPFFKSRYADLSSVWDAIRIPLTSNGLAVIQSLDFDEKGTYLITKLIHSSGQYVDSKIRVEPVKSDPQGMGSALTYMRRYALQSIAGVAPDDDDGEGAMNRSTDTGSKPRTERKPKEPNPPEPEQTKPEPPKTTAPGVITDAQRVRMRSMATKSGYTQDMMKQIVAACGYESSKGIQDRHYKTICDCIDEAPVADIQQTLDYLTKYCKEN